MIPDDESDPFRGEVSSWWNFRDETFIFTIHAFLIIFEKKLSVDSEGLTKLCSFR